MPLSVLIIYQLDPPPRRGGGVARTCCCRKKTQPRVLSLIKLFVGASARTPAWAAVMPINKVHTVSALSLCVCKQVGTHAGKGWHCRAGLTSLHHSLLQLPSSCSYQQAGQSVRPAWRKGSQSYSVLGEINIWLITCFKSNLITVLYSLLAWLSILRSLGNSVTSVCEASEKPHSDKIQCYRSIKST